MFEQHELIVNLLESVFNLFGWWGIAGLMALDSATGLTPATAVLALSGWLLISLPQQPAAMVLLGSASAAFGGSLGASLVYWLARLGGRAMVDRLLRRLHVKPQAVQRVEQRFHKHGALMVAVGRFLPGVRQIVSIPAGLARMPFWKFLLSTLSGSFLWAMLYIGGGYYLGKEWPKINHLLREATPFLLAAGIAGAAIVVGFRLLARRRAQAYLES